jgi:HK97 family phage prohead protease
MKFKTFAFKSVTTDALGPNEFAGYASVFGIVDDGGDIVQKGAFKDAIPGFLKDGFIAWQHEWDEPIGKPLEAKEDDHGLWIKARLSDTQQGREARTLILDEVVQKLSFGYEVASCEMMSDEQGIAMLGEKDYLRAKAGLPWYKESLRLLTGINPLFEVSPVSVPMNNAAEIIAAKGIGDFDLLTHSKKAEIVGPMVDAYLRHTSWKATERGKENRKLSDVHIKTLTEMLLGFKASADEIEGLLKAQSELGSGEETAPLETVVAALVTDEDLQKAHSAFLRTCARMNGVAI